MTDRGQPSVVTLAIRETQMQLRLLRRNPLSVLFTVALPLLLLPLLDALNGDVRVRLEAAPLGVTGSGVDSFGTAPWMQYATPAIAAFAVVAACFANLAIRTAVAREQGVLKRVRGTPLPPSAHMAGRVLSNAVVAVVVAVTTLATGVLVYGVEVAAGDVPVFVALVALGAAAFSALGLAATGLVPNSDAAPAIVYALLFPLAFLSNVFYPPEVAPDWMQRTAEALPLGPFVSAAVGSVTPPAANSGVLFAELAAIGAWGIFGTIVALVTFRWVPNRERTIAVRRGGATLPRRLAIPLALLVLTLGVVVPDDERPPPTIAIGTLSELARDGTLTGMVNIDPAHLEVDGGADPGVGLPPETFAGGVDTTGLSNSTVAVTVIDAGTGSGEAVPVAYGFPECGVVLISQVDAEWLGLVTSDRRGGSLVQPCTGAVYEKDGSCAAGPCTAPVILPVTVTDGRVEVTAKGRLDLSALGDTQTSPAFDPGSLSFVGTVTIGTGDNRRVVNSTFRLRDDDQGLSIVAADGSVELTFQSSSPLAGTIFGAQVLGPPDLDSVVASFSSGDHLPFLSLETGSEVAAEAFGTAVRVSRPEADRRVIQFGPDVDASTGDDALPSPRGELVMRTTGPLAAWTSIAISFDVDGAEPVLFDLTRSD